MNVNLFLSSLLFSLLISISLAAKEYTGNCLEIKKVIEESECDLEECLIDCKTNNNGKVTTLEIDDIKLVEPEIKKILSYNTITTLRYEAHCPVQGHCIKKEEIFPSVIANLTNLVEFKFNYNRQYQKRKTHRIYYTTIDSDILNKFKSLKKLELGHITLSQDNLDEIQSLSKIKDLTLNDCPMGELNFEFLKKMKNIKILNVYNIKETIDVTNYLKNLNKLRNLTLTVDSLTQEDVNRITELINLEELYLEIQYYETELNFKSLSNLTELSRLVIDNSDNDHNINNLSFKNLKNLEYLKLYYVDLTQDNINELSKLKYIETLHLYCCGLNVDFSPIKNLKNIVELYIKGCDEADNDQILLTICSLKKLEKLEVSGIYGKIPSQISNLKKLEYLDMTFNGFESLPDSIGSLKNIEYIDLSYNTITEIPKSMGKLKNLVELKMDSNSIKLIPDEIGNMRDLKLLTLSSNNIENMPKSLGKLENLEYLNLSYNRINDEIPESLNSLEKLKYIDLRDNYNIKGKTLTNPNIEECYYIETFRERQYSLCIPERMECMGSGDYSKYGINSCE